MREADYAEDFTPEGLAVDLSTLFSSQQPKSAVSWLPGSYIKAGKPAPSTTPGPEPSPGRSLDSSYHLLGLSLSFLCHSSRVFPRSELPHFPPDWCFPRIPAPRMERARLALLLLLLACVERGLSASCVVDSFKVKEDFDPKRVSAGTAPPGE